MGCFKWHFLNTSICSFWSTTGVRSVLGPLLFILYINDLADLQLGSKMFVYADDILLYGSIETNADYNLMQEDVTSIEQRMTDNSLTLNATKCKQMLITRSKKWAYCTANSMIMRTQTPSQFYLSCIRPHLEYACTVWDPHLAKEITLQENVQKFACKICCKSWLMDYDSMLAIGRTTQTRNECRGNGLTK